MITAILYTLNESVFLWKDFLATKEIKYLNKKLNIVVPKMGSDFIIISIVEISDITSI
jgi:hypothetical protein